VNFTTPTTYIGYWLHRPVARKMLVKDSTQDTCIQLSSPSALRVRGDPQCGRKFLKFCATFRRHLKSLSFPLSLCYCLVTHLSASDSFSTMALYKSIYVLTYFLTYLLKIMQFCAYLHGTRGAINARYRSVSLAASY